ncbi:unnamed protein product [Linum tenue]|uniref:Uncharacterized protein n=1 Tax=Linum tenue TaxID=586396 RepID=A0AAV0HS04_9ROSI|nr:unnamed protein product [Linum tenue]
MASSHLPWISGKDCAASAESVGENEIDEMEYLTDSEQYDSEDEDEQEAKFVEIITEMTDELSGLRTLITKATQLIVKVLGESKELCNMRENVLSELEKIEGLTRHEVIAAMRRLRNEDRQLELFYSLDNNSDRLLLVQALLWE